MANSVLGDQLEFYWNVHLWPRLAGLGDDELFWEPAPGAWNVRPDGDGVWHLDGLPIEPPIPPVTTIAWRIVHVGRDVLGKRARAFFAPDSVPGGAPSADAIMYDDRWWPEPLPTTGADALAFLQQAYELWRSGVEGLDDEAMARRLGVKGGPYAEHTMEQHVAHINREVIAHGAEICLLRDLYRSACDQADPLVAAALAGRADEVRRTLGGVGVVAVRPTLTQEAAGLEHWDVVRALLDAGADPNGGSQSALHYVAARGDVELAERLVAAGADLLVTDPTYHLTPKGWAEFFGRAEVASRLELG